MVYHGPSKGCRTCRKRRVKCDQLKPACNNCTKRKVECPGYESTFDYRHRNQTDSTILRAQQKADILRRKPQSLGPASDTSMDLATLVASASNTWPYSPDMAAVMSRSAPNSTTFFESSISFDRALDLDPESLVLNWYFQNYPMKSVDPQSSHGFANLLKPLYLSSPSDSPLRPAVAAVASNLLMLFCHQGSDTDMARKFYSKSVSRMKEIITDPVRSKQDDLLLTTLALNFYDNLNMRWSPDPKNYNNHRDGALALVKHRGAFNTQTEVSKHMTSCIRSALCHWALESGSTISPEILQWLTDSSVPTNKACELDNITLALLEFRASFNNFYRLREKDAENETSFGSMLDDGLSIDKRLVSWADTIPGHWKPLYQTSDQVLPSLKEASFYSERCTVYWDLSICDTMCTYRQRRLLLLRMLRQLYIDSFNPQYADDLNTVEDTMQRLIDEECESVPFLIGDVVDSMEHPQLYDINYPSASNGICTYPNIDHDHPRAAASTGVYLCSSLLVSAGKLAVKGENLDTFPMRRGQFYWMLGQLDRLRTVFLLSQPKHRDNWRSLIKA